VLDGGARAALTAFAERGVGDVFVSWENEAFLAMKALGASRFELVMPSMSILAEPPVAVVDRNVDRRGTRAVAEAYLQFLYSPEGQEIVARHHFRPRDPAVAARYSASFGRTTLFTIDEVFGGWTKAQAAHFADQGFFDRMVVR
jgi:sulfate/thiosulfate transport system substrate-binding protein